MRVRAHSSLLLRFSPLLGPTCAFLRPLSMASAAGDGCCPPGSHGAPPAFDAKPDGIFLSVGKDTPCYYVAPSNASNKAMILFPDIWGLKSRIVKISDWLAQQASCHVLVCDCFRGETKDDHADMKKWFLSVPYEPNIASDVTACVDYLEKEKQVASFGAMGFCWGNWAIGKTCQFQAVPWKVAVCPHPSFKVENMFGGGDIEVMQSIACPVLMMPAGNDPPYLRPNSEEFKAMPHKLSKSVPFEEMKHGWTTRGDMTDPKMKRDVEAALQETLKFIKQHL